MSRIFPKHMFNLDLPPGGLSRPVEDVLWTDEAYHEVYRHAGLRVIETDRPLGRATEPHAWVSETTTAPWVIYVLAGDPETAPGA